MSFINFLLLIVKILYILDYIAWRYFPVIFICCNGGYYKEWNFGLFYLGFFDDVRFLQALLLFYFNALRSSIKEGLWECSIVLPSFLFIIELPIGINEGLRSGENSGIICLGTEYWKCRGY